MGVAKSWTRLSDFTFTFHFHALEEEMATHSSVLAWRIPASKKKKKKKNHLQTIKIKFFPDLDDRIEAGISYFVKKHYHWVLKSE